MFWLSTAAAACLAIRGGEVFDGEERRTADVVIDGSSIRSVGTGLDATGCTVIEVPEGGLVTPGFVDVYTSLGLSEVGLEDATVDLRGSGDPIRASLRVTEAYNPNSAYIPIWRKEGLTSAVVVPEAGLVAGQLGWVRLAGATQEQTVVAPSIGMAAHLSGDSKAQALQQLRELLQDARAFAANTPAVTGNRFRSFIEGASRHDLEALGPVVRGEIPLVLHADRASDIEATLRLADELELKLVIAGGAEAHRHAERLAAAEVPVVLTPMVYGPGSFDQLMARPDNAALLADAGVTVLLRSEHNYNAPSMRFVAGNAVREGLDHTQALRALTSAPAKVFGREQGRLAAGAPADVVIWSGDPFEFSSFAVEVIIDGERRQTTTRQDLLFDRYRNLPGTPVPPLKPAVGDP